MSRKPRNLSRKKRFAFSAAMALGTWLSVELISLVALQFCFGGLSQTRTAADGASEPDGQELAFEIPDEVVHPYVGFVRRPGARAYGSDAGPRANEFGFPGPQLPFLPSDPDQVVIAIVGGSVAEQFSARAGETFQAELRNSGWFSGRRLVLVPLALSGHKQPQQLMVVNYLLALGARFDILVNLDGYNEIVLPAVENAPEEVFPSFPRGWPIRVSEAGDAAVLRSAGRIALLREKIHWWARMLRDTPLRYSPTANLVWKLAHAANRNALFREFHLLRTLKSGQRDYAARGPAGDFDSDRLHRHCAEVWMRSSLQIHQLCAASGIQYFHFLQPNQYVPGSKTLSDEERLLVYGAEHPGRKHVEAGYPLLVHEGQALIDRGVCFSDLTLVFADHPEPTYADRCCHLNPHGNEVLARKMADVIVATLRADSSDHAKDERTKNRE